MAAHLTGHERLLVRLPRWLGDLVMAEPVLAALAEGLGTGGHPGALALAGPGRFLDLLRRLATWAPRIADRDWVPLEGERWPAALGEQDVVLLATGSFRSALEAWRAGVPRRVGWARDGRGALLTDAMVPARERGAGAPGQGRVGRWPRLLPRPYGTGLVELAAQLGVATRRVRPALRADPEAREQVARLLDGAGITGDFLLWNLAGRPGSSKGLPAVGAGASVRAVLGALQELGDVPALVAVAGPDEAERTEELQRALAELAQAGRPWGAPTLVLGGTEAPDLVELLALGERAGVALTTDSGPRHLFAALGARLVVLFGPTDPRHTADHLARTTSLVGRVACGPCHLERCDRPPSQQLACWGTVEPLQVAAAVGRGLAAGVEPRPRTPSPAV
jgi:heptosyltransferase-2